MGQFRSLAFIACMKTLLCVFNLIYCIIGLTLMVLGLWAEIDLYKYMELSPEFSGTAPHAIIGMAALMITVTSVGFSCIIKGQPALLYIYGAFLLCIFVMEFGFIASIRCFKDTFAKGLYDGLTQSVKHYETINSNFDLAQSTMKCCGVSNYTDWITSSPQRVIPTSCCIDTTHCVTANYNDVFQRGCYEVIYVNIKDNFHTISLFAIFTSILPVFGAGMACGLGNYIRRCQYEGIT